MMRRVSALLSIAAMALVASHAVIAQQPATPVRSATALKVGADARMTIDRIIDSARVAGLPTDPLSDKVLEGLLKGADDARIVSAVQSLFRELSAARSVVGSASDVALLGAAASALHAGVAPADLRRLVRPAGGESPEAGLLTSALVVLADIVAKHVPATVAASAIGDLLQHGAPARQFLALRGEVEQDILSGRTPEAAMLGRTRAHLRTLDVDPLTARPVAPPRPPDIQDVVPAL